jgi:microcystin-dependent protein
MSPATTPPPKTWARAGISATDLNREIRDQLRDLQRRINALSGGGGGSLFPAGAVMPYGGSNVPTGWLLCDGRTVLRDDFFALFNAIGSAYNTGGETTQEFRLPKLNEALPRNGATAGNGNLGSRGVGAGQNNVPLAHPANVATVLSPNPSANQSTTHVHDAVSIHQSGAHTESHNHGINQNTGGHNHNMGHNHNLPIVNNNVLRNTGTTIVAVAHNHSCDAVNVNTDSDGAHNHSFSLASQNFATSAPSTDTGNFSAEYYNATNFNSNHTHDIAHSHTWGGEHNLSLVPPSVSVNYIIKI